MKLNVIQDPPKFKCNACGKCCSHIRGMIAKEDVEFLNEFVFGKLPVVQLVPIQRMTFPLWDWEAKRFRKWQEEINIEANIKPFRAIYDLKSGNTIVLSYFMDAQTDACPFLSENKCSIYHTKRAYVCRLFPFNRGPFSGEVKNAIELFGECGAIEKIIPKIPLEQRQMASFLNEAFPDGSFVNAIQNDFVIEWANRQIVELMRKDIIRPALNCPYDILIKKIENSKKIDFTDFLIKSGHISQGDMQQLLKRFDDNSDALEKIKEIE